MRIFSSLFLIFCFAFCFVVAKDDVPAPDVSHLIFFVQYDMPNAERLKFSDGYKYLLKELDPETHIEFYYFIKDMIRKVQDGKAGELTWPVANPSFVVGNPSTVPYENLNNFLQQNSINGKPVFFVTNGVTEKLRNYIDRGGFNRGKAQFSPQLYEPIREIVSYCDVNNVFLVGLYVTTARNLQVNLDDFFLQGLRYTVDTSGGKTYFNYTSFEGLFKNILKKHIKPEKK